MSGSEKEGAHSDLKIVLFEKHPLKKNLYSALMRQLTKTGTIDKARCCLLEVKFANDVFTVTVVLLGLEVNTGETVLVASMREALNLSLGANIKFELAFAKWAISTEESHEKRIKTFVDRAADSLMIKQLQSDKIFVSSGNETRIGDGDGSSVLSQV